MELKGKDYYIQIYSEDQSPRTGRYTMVGLCNPDQEGEEVSLIQHGAEKDVVTSTVDEYGYFIFTQIEDPEQKPVQVKVGSKEIGN